MTTTEPLVEIQGLHHAYPTSNGPVVAVQDVSFSVASGEIVAVVGPSGAGKTTVLRAVAGLLTPTAGRVVVEGRQVTGPPEGAAVVFQDYSRSLMAWLTVVGNVTLPLRAKGLSRAAARDSAARALRAVGLEGKESLHPWQLSGGMQQRVAIARALAYSPRLLLMDEPFASVDAQTRMDLEDLVLPLRAEFGVSILLVTHDIDEAVYLGDRVVALSPPPSVVARVVDVELPSPRSQIASKELAEYARARHEVLSLVRRPAAQGVEQ